MLGASAQVLPVVQVLGTTRQDPNGVTANGVTAPAALLLALFGSGPLWRGSSREVLQNGGVDVQIRETLLRKLAAEPLRTTPLPMTPLREPQVLSGAVLREAPLGLQY